MVCELRKGGLVSWEMEREKMLLAFVIWLVVIWQILVDKVHWQSFTHSYTYLRLLGGSQNVDELA